jgi:hypothetical protein
MTVTLILVLSCAVSGGYKREVPGDFGGGLVTALQDSAEVKNPSMTGRWPALTRISNTTGGVDWSHSRLLTSSAEMTFLGPTEETHCNRDTCE